MDAKFKIEGIEDLSKKLNDLSDKMAAKAIRSSVAQATTPALQKMKLAVPVGSKAHKTYKGRLVAPGFLKRSIKRKSYIDKETGNAGAVLGVSAEAFYGVQFLDRGTRFIRAKKWFVTSFESTATSMLDRFKASLAKKIEQVKSK